METLDLIIDFHKNNPRQGPGSQQSTIKALQFLPQLTPQAQLLDVGCGTGAQTMVLSEQTPAHITAVDSSKEFLSILKHKALQQGITNRLTVKEMGTVAEKTAQIEEAGYIPVAHFILPESDWTSH